MKVEKIVMKKDVRALLKLSGETLSGVGKFGISKESLDFIIEEVIDARLSQDLFNLTLAIVIGGGNIWRGCDLKEHIFGEDTAVADYMGMLATLMNCICFKKVLKQRGLESRVMSAIKCNDVCEEYHPEVAMSHLEKGRIVILAGGLGMPFLSTDMTMVLRAKELGMDHVLKGTKVNGIYNDDPAQHPEANLVPRISHDDYLTPALSTRLKIVDFSAVAFASQKHMPIRVFNIFEKGNLRRVLADENIGSVIFTAV